MRTNEEQAIERFKAEGWTPIRGGWPDYLLVRSREGKLELMGVELALQGTPSLDSCLLGTCRRF
jgi:hypothetical protein